MPAHRCSIAFALAIVVSVWSMPSGHAQPLLSPPVGGPLFVGPASAHPTAVHYNPAALSLITGTRLAASGLLRLDRGEIQRDPIDPATGRPGGSTRFAAAPIDFASIAGFAGLVSSFGRLTFGMAVYTPVSEDGNFAADGPLRYHRVQQHHRETRVSMAMGTRITDRLRAGAGIAFSFTDLELSFVRATALERGSAGVQGACGSQPAPCGVENPAADQLLRLDTEAQSITFNIGLALALGRDFWLGLAYLPPASPGGMTSEGPATAQGPDGSAPLEGRAAVVTDLPQQLLLGVRGPLGERTELAVAATFRGLAAHQDLDLRFSGQGLRVAGVPERIVRSRSFQNAGSLSAEIDHRPWANLRAGAALELATSAIAETAVTAASLAAPEAALSVGAEMVGGKFTLSFGYGLTARLTQNVSPGLDDPGDTVSCVDSGFDLDECEAVRIGRGRPSAAGDYQWLSHQLTLGMEIAF